MYYKIAYTDKLGERQFARTTDSKKVIKSDDLVMMEVLADALNRMQMTPDEKWGKDFKVVKVAS